MTVSFALFYLIGCFIEVSFHVADWDKGTRGTIGIFGGLMAILLGGAIAANVRENK